MVDLQIDNRLLSTYYSDKGNIKYKLLNEISKEDLIYLKNRFEYIDSIKEALFRLKHNIEIRPTCKICGGYVKFGGKITRPYSDCCCQTCADKYRQIKIKETALLRYGVDHPAKSEQSIKKHKEYYHKNNIKEKLHNAVKEKYGVDNVFQLDSVKEKINNTSLSKYGTKWPNQSKDVKNKIKESNNKNFGVDYGFQSPIVKEKIKQSVMTKYGVDNPAKSDIIKEKTKETDLLKYGNEYHIASDIIREKTKQTVLDKYGVDHIFKAEEIKNKIKESNINKYGCEYHTQTDEYKKFLSELMTSKEMREQIYNTHKRNNSFKQSKDEDKLYEILKEKYPNAIRQYKSELYPFNCDFYIPNYNDNKIDSGLYIEYNGTWTHGKHPFDSNNKEDLELINAWKEKNTPYYNGAIYNWTILDILKRNTANENNLNYKELWNMKEAIEYINNL